MFEEASIELEKHFRTGSACLQVRGQQWTFGEGSRGFNPWDSGARFEQLARELGIDFGHIGTWRRVEETLSRVDSYSLRVLVARFEPHALVLYPQLRNALGQNARVSVMTPIARDVGCLTLGAVNERIGKVPSFVERVRAEAIALVKGALSVYEDLRAAREEAKSQRRADLLEAELEETRIRLWGKP